MEFLNRKQSEKNRPYIQAFLAAKIKTNARSFTELEELYGRFFFNPEIGTGLFPYNIGWLEHGKFNLAVFGESRREVVKMYEDFKTLSGN